MRSCGLKKDNQPCSHVGWATSFCCPPIEPLPRGQTIKLFAHPTGLRKPGTLPPLPMSAPRRALSRCSTSKSQMRIPTLLGKMPFWYIMDAGKVTGKNIGGKMGQMVNHHKGKYELKIEGLAENMTELKQRSYITLIHKEIMALIKPII